MIFTVFGIYPDNKQRHADSVEASDPEDAEVKYREANGEDMLIAAVLDGDHTPIDSKMYAYE